jgi:phosphate:Na+ symporter
VSEVSRVDNIVDHLDEAIGDIIDKNFYEVAAKKIKRKLQFSNDAAAELQAFHNCVLDNLRLAFAVFRPGNVNDASKPIPKRPKAIPWRRLRRQSATNRHIMASKNV